MNTRTTMSVLRMGRSQMIKKYLLVAGIAGALFLVYGLVGNADRVEAERQAEQYCEMVSIWHDSNGQAGWPPYKGECKQ